MVLDIKKYGEPVLKRKSEKVNEITDDVLKLIEDMVETMYHANGVGLAAPQVGVSLRIVTIDVDDKVRRVINPEIIEKSTEECIEEEGCLSIPTIYEKVKRPKKIRVKYMNEKGQEIVEEADGILARAFQHEIDHLDGIVFVEKISNLAKNLIAKKLLKMKKENMKGE